MAIMTKGPVALILIGGSLGFGWILLKFKSWKSMGWIIPWILIMLGLSSIWFIYITKNYGSTYVDEFIKYQIRLFQTEDAKHGGTILFHPIALLLGCFPASVFMWSAFQKSTEEKTEFQHVFFKMMLSCGIIVLTVFTLVQTKIIHYSSMDYYPMTFFSAFGLSLLIDKQARLNKIQISLLVLIGSIWGIALTITPYLGVNIEKIKPYIKDANFLEQLKTPIDWHTWTSLLGILFLALYFYGIFIASRHRLMKGIIFLSIAFVLLIETISIYYLPKIENLVQGSMVEFCKGLQGKDVNTQTLYLKSYNQYFYSNRLPFVNKEDSLKHLYYLYHPIEKDCYFILRTIDRLKLDSAMGPNMGTLYSKNGFTFYKRTKN